MCGTGTATGGGAKRAGAEATTVDRAVAVRLLHRDEARRQKASAGYRVEAARLALFEHWLKIKNRAAPAVKREAGPRTAIKSSNKSAWPFDLGPGASLFRFKL
jgi:hypothetical protein